MKTRTNCTHRLLIAGLVAVPMAFTSGQALAQCSGGGCGGPSNLERAIMLVEASASTVSTGELQDAYDRIQSVAAETEELNVRSSSKVRNGLRQLAGKLEQRAEAELDAAVDQYFNGYHDEATATFEELAALKGLPTARDAERELDKEEDRVAWREANESAASLISSKSYAEAFEPVTQMQRLARRTGYTTQTDEAMKRFSEQLMPVVESASAMVDAERFDDAYATLFEISRLSPARESSLTARRMLSGYAKLPGMLEARGEYEAQADLTEARAWFAEITAPSAAQQQVYQRKLESIVIGHKGTAAADQAKAMLDSIDA